MVKLAMDPEKFCMNNVMAFETESISEVTSSKPQFVPWTPANRRTKPFGP